MSAEMPDPMGILDTSADLVLAMTGVKSQYIEAGWSPENAELMVVEMYRVACRSARRDDE